MIWSSILLILVSLISLFFLMNWTIIPGFFIMMLIVPLQLIMSNILGKIRKKILTFTDERIKITSEVLNGIKIIKFFTWEESFFKKINSIRKKELIQYVIYSVIQALINSFITAIPIIVSYITFLIFSMFYGNNSLDAKIIFPAIAYFTILRTPLGKHIFKF
jgi:ATP-binding cassette subfamily C (CFTR/MRP) protein 1